MIKHTSDGIEVPVKVTPKSNRNEIIGWKNDELCVRLAAVPEKGEANQELIKFLARALGVAKSQVELISGSTSRHKRLHIRGINELPAAFSEKLK